MKNKLLRPRNVFYVFIVLMSLVMMSTFLTSALYARYTVKNSSSDQGNVAVFLVTTGIDEEHITLDTYGKPLLELGGDSEITTASLPFHISSESEIAVRYTVSVDFGSALPEYLEITLTNGTHTVTQACDNSKSVFNFVNFGSIAPYDGVTLVPVNLELIITVTDMSLVNTELDLPSAILTVTVEQID